jgi:cysteine desulfurase
VFQPVYLDHNATTPLDPAVLAAMLPWLESRFGNASSRHEYGRAARRAIDEARQQVAAAVNAHPTEVVFTSNGSEANNLLIKGVTAGSRPACLAVSAIEHPCVLKPAAQLARQGWQVLEIAVDAAGQIDRPHFEAVIAAKPRLVSLMLANNETGVIQDIPALADLARASATWFHSDAVQGLGKLPIDFRALNRAGLHAMTLSAHKAQGPQGVAALVLDKRLELQAQVAGGGQERGLRSGTENVAAIVGFGVAAELAVSRLAEQQSLSGMLKVRLEAGVVELGGQIFSADAPRLANTSFFAFADVDGETLVGKLDRAGFAVASGAACSSANPEPSHVLRAMGVDAEMARGAIRVSVGRGNTVAQIDEFIHALRATLVSLRGLAALAA